MDGIRQEIAEEDIASYECAQYVKMCKDQIQLLYILSPEVQYAVISIV